MACLTRWESHECNTSGQSATSPPSAIFGSSMGQRGYKKVHWTERGLNMLVESSRVGVCHECFHLETECDIGCVHCSDDYDPSRKPRPLLQSSRVFLLAEQMRSGSCRMQANWRVTVEQIGHE